MGVAVVWFRRDARLHDNPAWEAGSDSGRVCPVFVIDPRLSDSVSTRRRQLLLAGLAELDKSLQRHGGRLMVLNGDPIEVIPRLMERIGASSVHANADVTPFGVERDRLVSGKVDLQLWDGNYVHPPGSILTNDGDTYRVFTPFYRSWQERPIGVVGSIGSASVTDETGDGLESYELGNAGESAAMRRLEDFLQHADRYAEERDRPDLDHTSRLSIDLKYGWIGPRTVFDKVNGSSPGRLAFVRQLAWRDFYAHIMARWPESVDRPMRSEYESMAWRNDRSDIGAWKSGLTGFPIVDAGMRQLRSEGWIHNRVRMLVASFLVKDLLVDWRIGEVFLRRMLLDGDTPQNVGNWQWVAGVGTDAAPYFRVFNPVTQSKKFDPNGDYIRRWVPELQRLEDTQIHSPWTVGADELEQRGVILGNTYPEPIVDHAAARVRAIEAYEAARYS